MVGIVHFGDFFADQKSTTLSKHCKNNGFVSVFRLQGHQKPPSRALKNQVFSCRRTNHFFILICLVFGQILAPKRHPKTTLEVTKNLIEKCLNSGEGLRGCLQVWHYSPGGKFARERRGFGRIPYWRGTFQHASSLSRERSADTIEQRWTT